MAVKYLAGRDSSIIDMIGAGMQAEPQLLAISGVLPRIEEVKVFDKHKDTSLRYTEEIGAELGMNIV